MRVALGQFNAVVGDMAGNARKMREIYARAIRADVDLLAFPELAVCGYPPEDLLHKRHFLTDCSLTRCHSGLKTASIASTAVS